MAFQFPRLGIRTLIRDIRRRSLERTDFASGLGDSAWTLYALARSMKPEVCVEIGSARGRSACFVGMALRDNKKGKLFAIDPHMQTEWNDDRSIETIDIFRNNIKHFKLEDYIEIVRKMSGDAASGWTRPIDLLFIDGDHSYDGVKRDWDLFSPFVSKFGVVVFHDTIWEVTPPPPEHRRDDMGVPRFVDELRRDGYQVLTLNHDCGVSLVQPVKGGVPLSAPGNAG